VESQVEGGEPGEIWKHDGRPWRGRAAESTDGKKGKGFRGKDAKVASTSQKRRKSTYSRPGRSSREQRKKSNGVKASDEDGKSDTESQHLTSVKRKQPGCTTRSTREAERTIGRLQKHNKGKGGRRAKRLEIEVRTQAGVERS